MARGDSSYRYTVKLRTGYSAAELRRLPPSSRQRNQSRRPLEPHFRSDNDLLEHCCAASHRLTEQPWQVMAIGLRHWAHGPDQ
jgi:hypothetical protein